MDRPCAAIGPPTRRPADLRRRRAAPRHRLAPLDAASTGASAFSATRAILWPRVSESRGGRRRLWQRRGRRRRRAAKRRGGELAEEERGSVAVDTGGQYFLSGVAAHDEVAEGGRLPQRSHRVQPQAVGGGEELDELRAAGGAVEGAQPVRRDVQSTERRERGERRQRGEGIVGDGEALEQRARARHGVDRRERVEREVELEERVVRGDGRRHRAELAHRQVEQGGLHRRRRRGGGGGGPRRHSRGRVGYDGGSAARARRRARLGRRRARLGRARARAPPTPASQAAGLAGRFGGAASSGASTSTPAADHRRRRRRRRAYPCASSGRPTHPQRIVAAAAATASRGPRARAATLARSCRRSPRVVVGMERAAEH